MKSFYRTLFIFNNRNLYTLWYTNDVDGLLCKDGKVIYFKNESELNDYAIKNNIKIEPDEIAIYDVDKIKKILSDKEKIIDCEYILDIWNMIADIAKTINLSFYGNNKEIVYIYSKLFYGNNLPSINTPNKKYIPIWDEEEKQIILNVLNECYGIFEISYG
jgi:hypothetical protein